MKRDLTVYWYRRSLHLVAVLLLPLSWLFGACAALRRWLYRTGMLASYRFSVPVIVVGNITVGGTGKTPFVIWLANVLHAMGYHPGIVSRGVGGKKHIKPYWVQSRDTAAEVGDEALLLRKHTQGPLVLAADRVAAVCELLTKAHCNIIICDDGLQHYRLQRDIEIAMVDGARRFGNQCLLPAGPLREPVSRIKSVDMVVVNGGDDSDEYTMSLEPMQCVSVRDPTVRINLADFPRDKVHAVAGIGNPQRFFTTLKKAGFDFIPHVFPDHHLYAANELDFADPLNVIMTEKDAVKCGAFADHRFWYLSVAAKMNPSCEQVLLSKLQSLGNFNHDKKDSAVLL